MLLNGLLVWGVGALLGEQVQALLTARQHGDAAAAREATLTVTAAVQRFHARLYSHCLGPQPRILTTRYTHTLCFHITRNLETMHD